MSRLIEDLLLLARSDSSGLDNLIKREPVQLDFVAREAFRTAEQLASGQRLVLDLAGSPVVFGDRDRLVQLVLIFLDNAIRHTPEGGTITVTVDSAEDAESGAMCARLSVSDTGSGIAPKHIPHLFERFYRAENARTRMDGGTGLGLSIALSIVRGHHGWIDVNSIVDEGTSFTVWLPVEAASGSNQSEPSVKHNTLQGVRTAVSDRWSALVSRLRRRP
jgi:signal transduction histidine kinase